MATIKRISKRDLRTNQGKKFMAEAVAVMKKAKFNTKCFCQAHNSECDVHPTRLERQGAIYVVVAGTTCVAWSRMGVQDGWIHDSAVVFLVWLFDLLNAGPDIIIQECTVGFDRFTYINLIEDEYHAEVQILDPREFGIPVKRARQFVIARKKSSIERVAAFDRNLFKDLFFKRLASKANVFFRAPKHTVEKHFEQMAIDRYLPNPDGVWDPVSLLKKTMQKRLHEYLGLAEEKKVPFAVFNLGQNAGFIKQIDYKIPTLLRKSYLWGSDVEQARRPTKDTYIHRPLMPYEHLGTMGWPVLLPDDNSLTSMLPRKFAYAVWQAGRGPKPDALRSMTGNGMHIMVMCSIWTFLLTASKPIDVANSASSISGAFQPNIRKRPVAATQINELKEEDLFSLEGDCS